MSTRCIMISITKNLTNELISGGTIGTNKSKLGNTLHATSAKLVREKMNL